MKIYLSPQINDNKSVIKINGEKVQIDSKLYDFTNLPNGSLRQPNGGIINAKRVDGDLHVEILNNLDDKAKREELFPVWQNVDGNDVLDNDLIVVKLDWYSDDERSLDELSASLEPTKEELEQAEFDLKLIEKLAEWGIL